MHILDHVNSFWTTNCCILGREKDDDDDDGPSTVKSPKGKKLPANVAAAKAKIPEVTISPDAQPDLKKALEVRFCLVVYHMFDRSWLAACGDWLGHIVNCWWLANSKIDMIGY